MNLEKVTVLTEKEQNEDQERNVLLFQIHFFSKFSA